MKWNRIGVALVSGACVLEIGGAAGFERGGAAQEQVQEDVWSALDQIEGRWVGELGGNRIEEVWLGRHGKNMTGCMRLYSDADSVGLYELMSIVEGESGLEFRLRHFGGEMNPWAAETEAPMRYSVEAEEGAIHFASLDEPKRVESIRYELEGDALKATITFPEASEREPLVIEFVRE